MKSSLRHQCFYNRRNCLFFFSHTIKINLLQAYSVAYNFSLFQCYYAKCLDLWSNLSEKQRETDYCRHLEEAKKCREIQDFAEEIMIDLERLENVLKTKEDIDALRSAAVNGKLTVYSLPDTNFAVPSFSTPSHESPLGFLHIRKNKCPIRSCQAKRSKQRTLKAKEQAFCLHYLANIAAIKQESKNAKGNSVPKINRELSIGFIMENIQKTFPNLASFQSSEKLISSRTFVESLVQNPERNEIILKHIPSSCKFCKKDLLDWNFPTKNSFLLSMGHIAIIKIPLKVCGSCRRVFYPGKLSILLRRIF